MGAVALRRPSLAFLVAAWIVFLLLGAGTVWIAVSSGDWPPLGVLLVWGTLWAGITGLLIRRFRLRSRIARIFPETFRRARFDAPESRPLVTVLLVLCAAIVFVAASLHFGWH